MPFLGTIVNFFAVLAAGILGSMVKVGIPKRISDAIMSGIGVCVIYIGIDGILEPAPHLADGALLSDGLVKLLIMIISIALGTLVGELINIDKWIGKLGDLLESKLLKKGERGNFARGFVSCSLLFCVGAMTVNGALADAVGNSDIFLAKSVIDTISCFFMASSLGIGCAFSAFFVLLYQGILTLLGIFMTQILPAASISYMSITGSAVIVLVGTNVLGITDVKTANMIPAIFLPALVAPLFSLLLSA